MGSVLIIQPWISYRGSETVSVQECFGLKRLGVKAEIAAIFLDEKRLPYGGKKVRYLLPPKMISNLCKKSKLAFIFLGPLALLFLVLKAASKFDTLNPHNLPSVWVASLVSLLKRRNVIWTAHSVEEYVNLPVISLMDNLLVKRVDSIIVPSNKLARVIKSRYCRESEVIVNPIANIKRDTHLRNKRLDRFRKKHYPLILHVGALHPQKEQGVTLKALKLLKKSYPLAGVVFVGEGPDEKNLKVKSEELKVDEDVLFAGFVPQEKLGTYYKACTINLLPSKNETFSGSPLEALLFGKTSIVAKDNGVLEIAGNYLLKASPYARNIAETVSRYLSDKLNIDKKIGEVKPYLRSSLTSRSYAKKFLELAA